jgi:hypothetical protein
MWEVPSLAMAFVCLKSSLKLKRFTISELEVRGSRNGLLLLLLLSVV